MAVEQGGTAAKVAESQQHRGEGGLAGPVGADQRDPPAGRQFEADPVQGGLVIFFVTYGGVSHGDGERPSRQGPGVVRFADRIRRIGDRGDPACRDAGHGRRGQRYGDAGSQQPGGEHGGGGGQDEQARGRRSAADQYGGQQGADAADEQVLGRVHVRDQPGEQVSRAE